MECPICGLSGVSTTTEKKPVKALYGPPIEVEIVVNTCPSCNESGDFEGVNDRPTQHALELSALRSVPLMMQELTRDEHYTTTYIERVTGLQFGSIARCLDGHYDAAVIIVLRMVVTYPPILKFLDGARDHHVV
jgi:hypothetical protein